MTKCTKCGASIKKCLFCKDDARHMIEGDEDKKTFFLCDIHVEPFQDYLGANEKVWQGGPDEIGAYCPGPDGCDCDSWM